MTQREGLIEQILAAFVTAEYPGDENLRNSNEGDEPFLLEEEFKGKKDWTTLDSEFLDRAPDDYSTALSFFSPKAFRFYLPAYLVADLRNQLQRVNLEFCLCHGLAEDTKEGRINPRRYGDLTWFEYVSDRFGNFTRAEYQATVSYLKWKRKLAPTDLERNWIDSALENFWLPQAERDLE